MADDTSALDIEADESDPDRKLTPEEQLLPACLVERICQALRLAGLPLAVETVDGGVYLEREGPISGPVDHFVISWHTTSELFDVAEATGRWVHQQRRTYRAGELDDHRKELLDEAGMVWEPGEEAWETKLAVLRSYHRAHGHLAPRRDTV